MAPLFVSDNFFCSRISWFMAKTSCWKALPVILMSVAASYLSSIVMWLGCLAMVMETMHFLMYVSYSCSQYF